MSDQRKKFLDLFSKSDSIIIDGKAYPEFEGVINPASPDPAGNVIFLFLDGQEPLEINNNDLQCIKQDGAGGSWYVAGSVIQFATGESQCQ